MHISLIGLSFSTLQFDIKTIRKCFFPEKSQRLGQIVISGQQGLSDVSPSRTRQYNQALNTLKPLATHFCPTAVSVFKPSAR